MYRDDGSVEAQLKEVLRRIRVLETQAPVGFTAVSRGALRILSSEGLIVVGTARTTGTQYVDGRLEGSGVFDWSGAAWLRGSVMVPGNLTGVGSLLWSGPWELRGNGDITGDVTLDGDLSLGSGRFVAGPVTIDKLGPAGGRIASVGQMIVAGASIYLGASTTVEGPLGVTGTLNVTGFTNLNGGLDVSGSKNFKMEHPTKPDHWLRHGSTESPVSGIEYWGDETLDETGSVTVTLPDYFEDLAKPEGRTVFVTGRGHSPDWTDIEGGKFTVTGVPGKRISWLVKAERFGGDFLLEEQIAA